MGTFTVGDIVLVLYPFSDFSSSKLRPALVVATIKGDDIVILQITSKKKDEYSIKLSQKDSMGLRQISYVRINKILTIEKSIIKRKVGTIARPILEKIQTKLRNLF